MSDNAVLALLIVGVVVIVSCVAICTMTYNIMEQKEITARQSKQAVESNFELAYKLWAEDRPRPVQAFPDWKKEHAMELSSGVLVVKLKDNSGDALGNTQN